MISSAGTSRTWSSCSTSEEMVHDPKNFQVEWEKKKNQWDNSLKELQRLKGDKTVHPWKQRHWGTQVAQQWSKHCIVHVAEEAEEGNKVDKLCLVIGGWPEEKAWRRLCYSLVSGQRSDLCPWEAEIWTSIYPCREANGCQRLEWVLSLYVNHSLEKALVNSTSCYNNSRMKHNFLPQCSQSRHTPSEPNAHAPVSQTSGNSGICSICWADFQPSTDGEFWR